MPKRNKKDKWVAVSGGFDPPHVGHLRMFNEAKKLGTHLMVIVNNDNWLKTKKGCVFMPENERVELLEGFKPVDLVLLTQHGKNDKDVSVCEELNTLQPAIFANGGDRKADNIPEYKLCESLGIEMVFNVGGGKVQSSSDLVKNANKKKGKLKW